MVEEQKEWYLGLTKKQKNRLHAIQWEIAESGYGKDTDFVMKTCWDKAVEMFKQELLTQPQQVEDEESGHEASNKRSKRDRQSV